MNKKRLFAGIFICFLSIAAFSKGSAEEDYATAKSLLEESKNTAALQDIVNVIENKPESIESGISLARKTMKNQAEFQKTFHELIELLKVDPNNNLKRIAIIDKMELLESDMDPVLRDFLNKVKTSSFYAIYRIKFNDLMNEGIKLIQEKKYNDAAKTFIQGFSMYDGDTMNEDQNAQISSILKKELDLVKSDTKKYEDAYAEFMSDLNKYRAKAFSSSLSSLESELNNLKNSSSQLRSITDSLVRSGASLKRIYLNERKRNIETEESILPFAYRLTLGRDSAKEYEGVEGAMEAGVHDPLYSLADRHWLEIRKLWFESCDTFDFESDISIDKNLSLIDFHLKSLTGIYSVINTRSGSRFGKIVDSQDKKRNSLAELNKIIDSSKKYYSSFLSIRERIQPLSSSYTGSSDELRNPDNPKIKTFKAEIQELESMISSVKKLSESSIPHIANDLGKEQEALETKNSLLLSNLDKTRLICYEELAIINNRSGKEAFAETKQRYDRFTNNQKNNDKTSPGEARQELINLREIIKLDLRILNNFIKDTDSSISGSSKVFAENKNGIEKTIASLKDLSGIIASDLALTESTLLKIQLAKNEADLRFEEAKRNLKSGNFSAARRSIELSRTRTNDALQLEEDAEYRSSTDKRLEQLGKEINDAENAVVVKDVRAYLEKAKKDYFNTEFVKAEETLNAARSRWAVTNIEPNEEVENWLAIVNTAGTLKTGRTIPPSAPLYPQMIQLLNNANQLYLDAEQKIKSGQRRAALNNLNQAKENIRQVLLIFPYNEIAGQLNLKIDKLIDPVNFNEQFKRKVQTIRTEYKRNSQKSYSDLLDLYGIDKNFPGLAALKNEVEIYLGLKLPPPNLKAIAESASLTKSAQAIYRAGDRLSFPIALQQLDTAIKLDPQNIAAIQLKDSIQMTMGGEAVVVLSAADEAKYQQAVSELQKGNRVIAAALVEQLMQSPNARNSAKVRELKKRIDALL
ncbi:hypothetical protein E4O03_03045 [Treponema sp. OMZ 792]|uniref:hypothetical protein n=1 Tax=unclassified Treponema TaxID=2638727 RepID=UPI0020A51392|nr:MULTISPECIES: hypothetical protein [unclassified Treponema]UTC75716.1 hypothetical protein E4O03_03045 [Treponema sp. OMZ 792]UTC79715.1 hypothetical protein E4O07_03055 [Treponema sp. OMZ 798]